MESKSKGAPGFFDRERIKNSINWFVLLILFLGYALTFTVPKFFGATDRYVSLFLFCMLVLLYFNNVGFIYSLKTREKEIFFVAGVVLLNIINFIMIDSNKGAILVIGNLLMIFYLSTKVKLTKWQVYVISMLYFVLYCVLLVYNMLYDELVTFNPNTAATAAIYTFLVSFVALQKLAKKYDGLGVLIVFGMVAGFRLVFWHRARGAAIMLLAFFFFYYIWPKEWWRKKFAFPVWFFLATIGSLLFVAAYVLLGTTGINFQIPFFYKPLFSGRNRIWMEIFQLFKEKPFTGIGTGIELDAFWEFNIHNAMYDLIAVYGIPVFLAIVGFLYWRMNRLKECIFKSQLSRCAFCALLAVFFESYFDIDLIWADYGLNVMFLLFVIHWAEDKEAENGEV